MKVFPDRIRTGAIAVAVLALALTLGGCGDAGQAGSGAGAGSATGAAQQSGEAAGGLLPAAEGTTRYPLTLDAPWGETTLEARPERIAVLATDHDAEYLSMLGVTPVFAPADLNDNVWMKNPFPQQVETQTEVPWDEPPYEAIAATRPDVIVSTFNIDQAKYERLRSIAPVVTVSGTDGEPDAEETWQEKMTSVAEALDLSTAAGEAIGEQEAAVAAVRDEHPEFQDKTISYAVYYDTENGLNLNNAAGSNSEAVFADLGFARHPHAEDFVEDSVVSNELLSVLDADVMLISDNSTRGGTGESSIDTVKDLELYQSLPVVQEGHTVDYLNRIDGFEVDGTYTEGNVAWALHASGPMAEVWAVQTLAPLLSDALAG